MWRSDLPRSFFSSLTFDRNLGLTFDPASAIQTSTIVNEYSNTRYQQGQVFRARDTVSLQQLQLANIRHVWNPPQATSTQRERERGQSRDTRVDSFDVNIPRTSQSFRSSNEARPTRPQEMESSGGGALAAQAAPLPGHSHTPVPFARMMNGADVDVDVATLFPNDQFHFGQQQSTGLLDTPLHVGRINRFQSSNVRESGQDLQLSPTSTGAATAANLLASTNHGLLPDSWAHTLPFHPSFDDVGPDDNPDNAALSHIFADHHDAYQHEPIPLEWDEGDEDPPLDESEQKDIKAYAKLGFPDGDYFITTLEVVLGRDMDFWREQQRIVEKGIRKAEYAVESYRPIVNVQSFAGRAAGKRSSEQLQCTRRRGVVRTQTRRRCQTTSWE